MKLMALRIGRFFLSAYVFQQVYALFEQRILDGTQEYYSKDSEKAMQQFYIDEKSFVAYLKHVQSSLHDEMKRATLLHPTTKTALMRVCCDSLITKHEDVFDAEFNVRLSSHQNFFQFAPG